MEAVLTEEKSGAKKAKSHWVDRYEWEQQRMAARESFEGSRDAYYAREGIPSFTRSQWKRDREEGKLREIKQRKAKMDGALIAAVKARTVAHRKNEGDITRARAAVLVAIINLVRDTSALYASEGTIAHLAKVSRRTVTYTMRWLEESCVLVRWKSGGLNMVTGKRASNKYRVSYEALRDFLGIEAIPSDFLSTDELVMVIGIVHNAYWSKEHYSRHSNSERAQRRRDQREYERKQLQLEIETNHTQEDEDIMEHRTFMSLYGGLGALESVDTAIYPVENLGIDTDVLAVENFTLQAIYQRFCALSNLRFFKEHNKTLSRSYFLRPLTNFSLIDTPPEHLTPPIESLFPDFLPNSATAIPQQIKNQPLAMNEPGGFQKMSQAGKT